MSDKKITELPLATSGDVNDTDKLIIQDGLNTKQISLSDFFSGGVLARFVAASFPKHYSRGERWSVAFGSRTTIESEDVAVNIGGTGYVQIGPVSIDLSQSASWDTTIFNYTTASNRAGKDFYVYAVQPSSGSTPNFVVSANSTSPIGYNSTNSRKIGGFHCLCVDVGTISGHDLDGFQAGDVLPASIWDLRWRSSGKQEGTVYSARAGLWVDIYLASWSGTEMESIYGVTIADGNSTPHFHWYNFAELFSEVGKRLPTQSEFIAFSAGSNQETNISGSSNPGTTGGHSDTNSRRMISDIGVEDACGVLWQWGLENSADKAWSVFQAADTSGDSGSYDSQNSIARGEAFDQPERPILGGNWTNAARCGSGFANWTASPLILLSGLAARGVASPVDNESAD